jgi:hypothetical protein
MRVSMYVSVLSPKTETVQRTSSIDRCSAATRFSVPCTTLSFDRAQGPHNHSFSSTVTTSLLMGGLWQYW